MQAFYLLLAFLALARAFRPNGGSSSRALLFNRGGSLNMAKEFSVRVINKKAGKDVTLKIPDNAYILDSFENKGHPIIPYSCRAGSCSSCLGKLASGTVDQSGQIFLDDDKIEMGYVLTCAAYPTSDIEIAVNVEDEYYNLLREE